MAPEWPGHDIAVKSSGSDFLGLNPGSGTRQLGEVGHVAPRVRAASLNALWLYGPLGIWSLGTETPSRGEEGDRTN